MTFGIRLPDVDEGFGLEIRRGVAQFYETLPDNADVVLEMNRSVLEKILLGEGITDNQGVDSPHPNTPQASLIAAFQSGDAKLTTGTIEDFEKFFSYFDPLNRDPIPLTIR